MAKSNYNVMINKLLNLETDLPIYITGHKFPDYDSLCSALALTLILNSNNKKAFMLIEEVDINKLTYFKSENYFKSTIKEEKYNFILIDANKTSRMASKFETYYKKAKTTLNIDHHNGNTTNADFILSIEDISSTSEIIYNITKKMKIKLNTRISELLFLGIVSDTDLFSNRTTLKTMKIVTQLMENNISSSYIIKNFYLKKTQKEMDIIADMLQNLEYDDFHYIVLDMYAKGLIQRS